MKRENPGHSDRVAALWSPATRALAKSAMDAAERTFSAWSNDVSSHRIELLDTLLNRIEDRLSTIAATITRENGKTRAESRAEVNAALQDARFQLGDARDAIDRPVSSPRRQGYRHGLVLEPVGVYLLITPWNFPFATVLRKLVPALAFGNTVVLKPSEFTPGPASMLFRILSAVGFPPGVANLILGTGKGAGPALVGHPALRGISFTGSNAVGLELARQTAGRDVRLQLEMGGKNSLVVLSDADLERAVDAAVIGGFSCAGQWCTGTGRVIVEAGIHDAFCDRLIERVKTLVVGPGDARATKIGPLVSAERIKVARSGVRNAVKAGANLRCGGGRPVLRRGTRGHFFAPTVLTEVTETMPAFTDELFIPVLPVTRAQDYPDALRLANSGPYGLSASIFTSNRRKADDFLKRIEAGIAHVNLHTAFRVPELPVAAWRDSGRGIPECGRFNRDFFTRPRAVYENL
jgi:aldehyde dehydrogenase (NAD+)